MSLQQFIFAATLSIALFHTSYIYANNSSQQEEIPDEKRTHTKTVKSKKQSPPLVVRSDTTIIDKTNNAARPQPALDNN